MELIDGVFYQSSNDNALVAITADYPGLVPASQVAETEVPAFKKGFVLALFDCRITAAFCRGGPRGRRPSLWQLANKGPRGQAG